MFNGFDFVDCPACLPRVLSSFIHLVFFICAFSLSFSRHPAKEEPS